MLAAGTDLHMQFAGTGHRAKREIIQVWTQSVFSVLKMGRLLYGMGYNTPQNFSTCASENSTQAHWSSQLFPLLLDMQPGWAVTCAGPCLAMMPEIIFRFLFANHRFQSFTFLFPEPLQLMICALKRVMKLQFPPLSVLQQPLGSAAPANSCWVVV